MSTVAVAADCICTGQTGCAEESSQNPCPHCRQLDIYDPCPRIGFGCGLTSDDCDCCTDEQKAEAAR